MHRNVKIQVPLFCGMQWGCVDDGIGIRSVVKCMVRASLIIQKKKQQQKGQYLKENAKNGMLFWLKM